MANDQLVKTLAAKLAEACSNVGGVEKKGRNEAQRYTYVKAADVAKAIRHELFERGVVIIPDEVECLNKQISFMNAKGETRNANEVQIRTAYHITDGHETLVMHGYGIAWDSGDKAIYKAKTGALKYFLRGLGLIPDEKDDPEADESIDRAVQETNEQYDQRTENQRVVMPAQAQAMHEAMKRTGKPEAMVTAYLMEHYKVNQFEKILRADFQAVLKWLNSYQKRAGDDLPQSSEKSVRDAVNKKLWAVAAERSVPEADVKRYAYERFGVDSMTALDAAKLREVVDWLGTLA